MNVTNLQVNATFVLVCYRICAVPLHRGNEASSNVVRVK